MLRFASPRPSLICGGFLWPSVLADIFLTYSLPQPPLYPDLGLWSVEWCVPGLTHWNFAHCLEDNLGGNEPARVFPPHFWPQGWGRGRAGQNNWAEIGRQRFPGCHLAKGLSLGILWPFLGTSSWSLAQVLGKDERVGASESRREELCGVPGFRGLRSTVGSQEVPGPVSEPLQA